MLPHRKGIVLCVAFTALFAQPPDRMEPTFCLLLSGKYYGGAGEAVQYSYQLSQTADSGAIVVQNCERPISSLLFPGLKKSIVTRAMELTGESYGLPRDSADFSGDLTITALDRATIIRFSTKLVIGTQNDSSMVSLLRLLMKQVEDTLRLPQFKKILSSKKYNIN